jgi:hypothetical protein
MSVSDSAVAGAGAGAGAGALVVSPGDVLVVVVVVVVVDDGGASGGLGGGDWLGSGTAGEVGVGSSSGGVGWPSLAPAGAAPGGLSGDGVGWLAGVWSGAWLLCARAMLPCPRAHTVHADSRIFVISRIEGSPWLTHPVDEHRACH